MTDEQFNQILSVLNEIKKCLNNIESNTDYISYVDDNTSKTNKAIKELKDIMVK